MSRFRYYRPAVTQDGKIITSATILVYEGTGSTLATIYESETGDAITSVTSNSTTGMIDFWVDEADYNGGQIFTNTISKDSHSSQSLPWSGQSIGLRQGQIQQVHLQDGEVATGTTRIIADDTTVPQNTEGDQYMSLAITPVNALNILTIDVVVFFGNDQPNVTSIILCQDDTTAALAAGGHYQSTANTLTQLAIKHVMTAGTVSETTFKVRMGGNAAGTSTFNGVSGARVFNGIMASSITITESTP